MKRYFLWLGSLIGLLSLTTCKPKAIGPSIDDVVGQYNATMEFTGGLEWLEHPIKSISVIRSTTKENVLEFQVVVDDLLTERWEIKFVEGGSLIMAKQDVYVKPTVYGYTNRQSKEGSGSFKQDSLLIKGEVFYEPFLGGSTFFKCRAKKIN